MNGRWPTHTALAVMKVQTLRANVEALEPLLAHAGAHISETKYGLTVPLFSHKRHMTIILYDQYVYTVLHGLLGIQWPGCMCKVTRI